MGLTSAQHALATPQSQGASTLAADQAAVIADPKNLVASYALKTIPDAFI